MGARHVKRTVELETEQNARKQKNSKYNFWLKSHLLVNYACTQLSDTQKCCIPWLNWQYGDQVSTHRGERRVLLGWLGSGSQSRCCCWKILAPAKCCQECCGSQIWWLHRMLGGYQQILGGSQKMLCGSKKMLCGSQKILYGSQKCYVGLKKCRMGLTTASAFSTASSLSSSSLSGSVNQVLNSNKDV